MNRKLMCTIAVFCVAIMASAAFIGLVGISQQDDRYANSSDSLEELDDDIDDEEEATSSDALGTVIYNPHKEDANIWIGDLGYSFNTGGTTVSLSDYRGGQGAVSVPDTIDVNGTIYTVTKIWEDALCKETKSAPTEVTIGANIEVIEDNALRAWTHEDGCLKSFKIRDIENSKLREIGDSAFRGQKSLTYVELPASLQAIKNSAFRDSGLQTCVLHSETLEIWESAFRCTPLKSINLENVTVLGNGAFHECTNLTYADLTSIQSIAKTSFRNCPLEKVIIGNNLTSIKSNSFYTTAFYDRSGTELDIDVDSLRNHAFEMIDGKLVMV